MDDILTQNPNSPAVKAKKLMELQTIYKELKPQIDELKADLLQIMQEQDVLTLKTGTYTLSRAKRITPQVIDFKTLKASLEQANIDVLTEEVFAPQMDIVFKQAIEEGKQFDGLESKTTEYVSVRIKEPKVEGGEL